MRAVEQARKQAESEMSTFKKALELRVIYRSCEYKQQVMDENAVDNFSAAMRKKLAEKRKDGRGGWDNKEECSNEKLSAMLREHVNKGDPIDVANFAMMIHQRGERIL